jgi:hypothetical protein
VTKLLSGILILLLPMLVVAESSSRPSPYQPATIVDVKLYPSPLPSSPAYALYEVSVEVDRTVYVVLTQTPTPSEDVRYAIGRELLVHVGEDTITWYDIMGQSHEVPIKSKTAIVKTPPAQN